MPRCAPPSRRPCSVATQRAPDASPNARRSSARCSDTDSFQGHGAVRPSRSSKRKKNADTHKVHKVAYRNEPELLQMALDTLEGVKASGLWK